MNSDQFHAENMYRICNSTNNVKSYFGLIDERMSAYDRTTCKCNNEIFLDYKLISLHFNCIYVSFYIADLPFLDLTSPR